MSREIAIVRPVTLILATTTLIIFVFGLLLPVICKVREAAGRIRCQNNLRQICLAAINYVDSNGFFPPGAWSEGDWPPEKQFSWFLAIEPWIEKNDIYVRTDKELPWDAVENHHLTEVARRLYLCPAAPDNDFATKPALSHYIGIAGVGKDAANRQLGDRMVGIFGYNRKVRYENITDGLSNTLLAMETGFEPGPWAAGGPSTVRGLDEDWLPYVSPDGQFGRDHLNSRLYRSNMIGGNGVYADGRVIWVTHRVHPQVFEAAATIAEGDVPGGGW